MLGFDVRTARATWTVALVVLAIYATYSIRRTLFVFVLAVFFSYLLSPLVRRLRQHAPKRLSHTASTAIIFGLLIAAIAALLALIAPPIVDQASKLSEQLPQLVRGSNVIDAPAAARMADAVPRPHHRVPARERRDRNRGRGAAGAPGRACADPGRRRTCCSSC